MKFEIFDFRSDTKFASVDTDRREINLSSLLVFPTNLPDLKKFPAKYYRTKMFHLDMKSFLLTNKDFPLNDPIPPHTIIG